MSTAEIKKFLLRLLLAADGVPMGEPELIQAVKDGFALKPLHSDVKDGLRELEAGGFVRGVEDELDRTLMTWTLTAKGTHKAKQLS